MIEYFYAKKKLFAQADRAVVCVDDRWGRELAETLTIPVQTVSRTGVRAAYSITDIESSAEGVRFTLSCFGLTRKAQFPVPGIFQRRMRFALLRSVRFLDTVRRKHCRFCRIQA